ncbi:DUF1579 family protein [Amycolatopsis aidingensis]|uniref:DUF1579 family protein n=1 Tax=Amycolatopsis aidingensis TaxID=2842453 RepID=UPI001C0BA4BF|nr:DUF1579 family protein [Amycolatopsis aidingensis]
MHTPGPELERLGPLVGRWRSQGRTVSTGTEPSIEISGTDTYEWLDGGFFLVHHVDVQLDGERYRAIELIGGYDPVRETYTARSYDSHGETSTMTLRVGAGGEWTFVGVDSGERATLTVGERSMAAVWERSADGVRWQPWMDMTFSRES